MWGQTELSELLALPLVEELRGKVHAMKMKSAAPAGRGHQRADDHSTSTPAAVDTLPSRPPGRAGPATTSEDYTRVRENCQREVALRESRRRSCQAALKLVQANARPEEVRKARMAVFARSSRHIPEVHRSAQANRYLQKFAEKYSGHCLATSSVKRYKGEVLAFIEFVGVEMGRVPGWESPKRRANGTFDGSDPTLHRFLRSQGEEIVLVHLLIRFDDVMEGRRPRVKDVRGHIRQVSCRINKYLDDVIGDTLANHPKCTAFREYLKRHHSVTTEKGMLIAHQLRI